MHTTDAGAHRDALRGAARCRINGQDAHNHTLASMSIALPASFQCDCLVLRRGGWKAILQVLAVPSALVSACVALACASLYAGYAWCALASGLLALVGSLVTTRWRLTQALLRARFEWCGALPASHRETTTALLVLGVVSLVTAGLAGTLALVVAAWFAPHRNALGFALAAFDGGLVVGFCAAAAYGCSTHAAIRVHQAEGIREPLLALRWLNDPKLPHLLDWQRRAALAAWRRGASLILVAPILALGPNPTSIRMLAGLILWVGTLVWFVVAARASRDVTRHAVSLLAATPLTAGRTRWSALRYPLIAAACAVMLVCVSAWLAPDHVVTFAALLACAAVTASWPLVDVVRMTAEGSAK